MRTLRTGTLAYLAITLVSPLLLGAQRRRVIPLPPGVERVRRDACPWEDCVRPDSAAHPATRSFVLRARPDRRARLTWRGRGGDSIRTMEYAVQVHTPGVILLDRVLTVDPQEKESPTLTPGDTVFVTSVEGKYYELWYQGQVVFGRPPGEPDDTTRYRVRATSRTIQPLKWSAWARVCTVSGRCGWQWLFDRKWE
jgi:hypothetical protein